MANEDTVGQLEKGAGKQGLVNRSYTIEDSIQIP